MEDFKINFKLLREEIETDFNLIRIDEFDSAKAPEHWEEFSMLDPLVRQEALHRELSQLQQLMPEFAKHIENNWIDVCLIEPQSHPYYPKNQYLRVIYLRSEVTPNYTLFVLQAPPIKDLSSFSLLNQYPDYQQELEKLYKNFFNGFIADSGAEYPLFPLYRMQMTDYKEHQLLHEKTSDHLLNTLDLSHVLYIGTNESGCYCYLNLAQPITKEEPMQMTLIQLYKGSAKLIQHPFWETADALSTLMYDGGSDWNE